MMKTVGGLFQKALQDAAGLKKVATGVFVISSQGVFPGGDL
ncbi:MULTISPECIES: replication/maintenance protein RepL [Novacetimonas]|uniref:Replication/maintenance protein RepL n=1 Tax=Novacetimonas hansenii TaxID=436 RepID=A0AAW5EUF0_NOVHA|nr:replication/maintenance protein RepL [Novacetimonas hansenii]MCJ8354935.1 replication/maintenance protein RepL [Novacetimonas hansenii]WEQ58438.1 hypothetical protein LV563_11385 [Novacetimonas hansenii]